MTITWTPFRNYQNTYHVLGAAPCFAHQNGNVYFYACEKVDKDHQNLVIYRHVAATGAFQSVATFIDGNDSQGFIERGGCVIDSTGALWVATSLQPKGMVYDSKKRTGYEGVWCRIPNVDAPYTGTTAHAPLPLGPHLTDFLSPTSATEDLYDKSYLPTDLDTPNKLALRITKQLFALNEQGAALRELVEALRKQGILG